MTKQSRIIGVEREKREDLAAWVIATVNAFMAANGNRNKAAILDGLASATAVLTVKSETDPTNALNAALHFHKEFIACVEAAVDMMPSPAKGTPGLATRGGDDG